LLLNMIADGWCFPFPHPSCSACRVWLARMENVGALPS
jgi:hypothetical protein